MLPRERVGADQGFTDSHPPQKDACRKPLGSDSLSVSD